MEKGLKEKISKLPAKSGIYFFKNDKNEIIYIGKARLLNERVRAYFQPTSDPKVQNIMAETADIDYILTDSEREASFLENNFIQQHQPKFNLRLKDDKSFPYLKLTVQEQFPGIYFSRKVAEDRAKYFGPFHPGREARKTIQLINKYFKIRGCEEKIPGKRKRPCLEYDLNLCSAPCIGNIQESEYREDAENALLFLEGKTDELVKILKSRMRRAAENQNFEEAARLRDIIQTLEQIKVKPKFISVALENLDIFGLVRENRNVAFYVFFMRRGKVIESQEFFLEEEETIPKEEILHNFLDMFYKKRQERPNKILLPFEPSQKEKLLKIFSETSEQRLEISVPSKGKYKSLVDLASQNAELLLQRKKQEIGPLMEIKKILGLKALPVRMEGFDVSNTSGRETVASSVTFEFGQPKKDGYRKYKVKTVEGPNDVASLEEVIRRRYSRLLEEGKTLPDLILIDGGKPQFSAALAALKRLGLGELPLVSLAKREEIIFTPQKKQGLKLDRTSPALKLLQHIRNEAHRFALAFHRQRRTKKSFEK